MPSQRKPTHPSRAIPGPARALWVLLAATALALAPVLFADFIRLDDYGHLFENPQLRRMSLAGLAGLWSKSYFNLYIPITYSVWWALATVGSVFGDLRHAAWLFHAFNLAVHLANATLVFRIVRTLTAIEHGRAAEPDDDATATRIALLAALLFALHPAQVESVAWISELKGELCATFGLLGLWWHLRGGNRLLVAALFVAAMLSKPAAIVFPGILFVVDRIVLRKRLAASATLPALCSVPLLALAIVTKHLQPDAEQDFIPTVAQRLVVAADAIAFYVSKVVVPFPLAVDYGRTPRFVLDHAPRGWLAYAAVLSIAGVAMLVRALVRPAAPAADKPGQALVNAGWAIFVLSLVPVLGFVPFGFQDISTVANHYLYIPMFGASVLAAGLLVRLRAQVRARLIAGVALAACAALSLQQAWRWRATEPLFAYTVKINPRSYLGYFCIGDELTHTGRPGEAIGWLERSLAIKPDYLNAVLTLGMAYTQKGDAGKAIELYRTTLARNPSIAGTGAKSVASLHNNLGMLLLQSGQAQAGVEHLHKAVEVFPRALNAHLNLGNLAFNQQRYADAVAEYQTALSLSPGNRGIEQRLDSARQHIR